MTYQKKDTYSASIPSNKIIEVVGGGGQNTDAPKIMTANLLINGEQINIEYIRKDVARRDTLLEAVDLSNKLAEKFYKKGKWNEAFGAHEVAQELERMAEGK